MFGQRMKTLKTSSLPGDIISDLYCEEDLNITVVRPYHEGYVVEKEKRSDVNKKRKQM